MTGEGLHGLCTVVIVSGLIFGCNACVASRDLEFSVAQPLKEARVFETSLFTVLVPQASMGDVVVPSISPLVPGMTLSEAQRLLGAPAAVRRDTSCAYYRFSNTPLGVELSHCTGNGSGGGTWEKWRVIATPQDSRVSVVFRHPVVALIERAAPVSEITIHEGNERATTIAFSAKIVDGWVASLTWFDITSFRVETRLHNKALKLTRQGYGQVCWGASQLSAVLARP